MKTRGTIAQLERRAGQPAPLAFWLVTSTQKIPVESGIDAPVKEGELVEVNGAINSNGTLIADSIAKVDSIAAPALPWKLILSGTVVALLVVLGLYELLKPSSASSYPVRVLSCGVPQEQVAVSLSSASSSTFNGKTNSLGVYQFANLPKGIYVLSSLGTQKTGIVIDGKSSYSTTDFTVKAIRPCIGQIVPRNPLIYKAPPLISNKK